MEQKFVKFEEALDKLGVTADQLNDLRERGELRAYRDGASWKFRADEIDRMAVEGVPEPPPPSDIGLVSPEDLVPAEPLATDDEEFDLELSDDDEADDTKISKSSASLKARDDSELELELADTDALSAGSELELAELEDTVTAGSDDLVLEGIDEPSEPSDSILLSEEELGESVGPHASTIIGKSELADADLQLAGDDEDDVHGSDVRLASSGASDVHSSQVAGSGVLDTSAKSSASGRSAFEDLEELEIDLAAESSRILSPEDVQAAKAAGKGAGLVKKDDSDLRLEDDDEGDDNNQGSTDVPLLELEGAEPKVEGGSGSDIELAMDDDLVLSDSGGSDITLDSGDSGINLVAPSDSGLALDDIPLDIGGSAILSSLSLSGGDSDPEISLVADDSKKGKASASGLQMEDDFQLTPMSDKMKELEGDSSSQVIALDADLGDMSADAPMFEDVGLTAEADEGVMLADEFGGAPAGELGVGYAPVATVAAGEFPYSAPNILALSGVALLLIVSGMMMLDIFRNIWSWQDGYSINSSLLDALLGMFGLK